MYELGVSPWLKAPEPFPQLGKGLFQRFSHCQAPLRLTLPLSPCDRRLGFRLLCALGKQGAGSAESTLLSCSPLGMERCDGAGHQPLPLTLCTAAKQIPWPQPSAGEVWPLPCENS